MRALITGGAGFIGSALVDRLLAEGHAVDVIDDLSNGSLANLASARSRGGAGHQLSFHQLDIRSPDLGELMARRRPELVFHLAAVAPPGGPVVDADATVVGSVQLLEGCRVANARKVVFAAAASIYGDLDRSQLPARESEPRRPLSSEGLSKAAVLDYLYAYRERFDLEFTALVLANVYGPRGHDGVVAGFARRLLSGEACTIFGDGRQTRDFVYVDDVVDAFARSIERGDGLMINIGTGAETSVRDLYATMSAAAEVDRPTVFAPGRRGRGEPVRMSVDVGRAAIHLGWKPWTSLPEGVRSVLAAFKRG